MSRWMQKVESRKGSILILSFMILIALISIVANYLYMTSAVTKSAGYGEVDDKLFWLAEAGIQKAVWNLVTTVGQGGEGLNWTTTGTTESLGDGTYTMVVTRIGNTRYITSTGSITTAGTTFTRVIYEEYVPGQGGPEVPPLKPNNTWKEQF
jgi:urease alpha subunit